jgi:FkbM family methyltransferase
MFPISLILPELPPIRIVDVGAMNTGDDPYRPLAESMACELVGFEPVEEECRKLNAEGRGACAFLPYVIGDGSERSFHECAAAYNSSLLEPNFPLLEQFTGFAELFKVVATSRVRTRRLDDVEEAQGAEFLKLDVQGAELMVLDGAPQTLRSVLAVHTEACFLPLYKDQPLFADLDRRLRAEGFVLHKVTYHGKRPFAPFPVHDGPGLVVSQNVWCDVAYVRDFLALDRLSGEPLLKLAAILHENYASCDFASLVLGAYDRKAGTDLQEQYLNCLVPK